MSQGGESARSDMRGGAGWIVFGLAIFVGAWRMDRYEAMGASLYTAPGLVPGVFGLVLIGLGAGLALRGWKVLREGASAAGEPLLNRRIVLMSALCLGYAAGLVGRLPFTLATALFVAAFTWVFADATPLALIEAVRPDVLVKGADYRRSEVVGANVVEGYGGRVHLAALTAGFSSSAVIERLKAA